ncbi:MAG: hypothetical protein QOF85_153 [Solirubrobacterales bacterium]|nr:hypothetical protein [Solirubrobacterales bacterium]
MMLSAHASLSERYRRRSTALILAVMALSILSATLALQDDESVSIAIVDLSSTEWLAALAGVIFFLSISELVLDWRGRAWSHEDAVTRLGKLKGEFRRADVTHDAVQTDGVDLDVEYDQTTSAVVEIPNSSFNRLKAEHRRKVAISRRIDEAPGAPLWLLRWRVFRAGLKEPGGFETAVLEESPPGTRDQEHRRQ